MADMNVGIKSEAKNPYRNEICAKSRFGSKLKSPWVRLVAESVRAWTILSSVSTCSSRVEHAVHRPSLCLVRLLVVHSVSRWPHQLCLGRILQLVFGDPTGSKAPSTSMAARFQSKPSLESGSDAAGGAEPDDGDDTEAGAGEGE